MFALIAYDVAAPSSVHLLAQLDAAVHQWVVTHTDAAFRATTADLLVSDLFITAGIWGWLATSCITLAAAPRAGALPLGIAWLAYYTTCGAVFTDPPLVSALKHAFGRVRPSTIHHTFSFPSGHTSAAVFIAGMLLVVLLPLASASLQSAQRRLARRHSQHNSAAEVLDAGADGQQQPQPQQQQQQQQMQLVTHDVATVAPTSVVGSFAADQAPAPAATAVAAAAPAHTPALLVAHHRAHEQQQAVAGDHSSKHRLDLSTAWLPDGAVLGLWGAAWGLTATGRVLADAHWVSDTLAGGCLAVCVVSSVACATQWLHNRRPRS
jgi:membrane-associated phospholipid phosphatase